MDIRKRARLLRQEPEVEVIKHHLKAPPPDPTVFGWIGRSGRRFLEEHNSLTIYAQQIVDLAPVAKYRLRGAALQLAVKGRLDLLLVEPGSKTARRQKIDRCDIIAAGSYE